MKDEQLSVFNRTSLPEYIEFCNNESGAPLKILVIGNSIAYHAKAEDIGWYYNHGMATSKVENDYAHLIFQKIEKVLPGIKVSMRIKNLADFERNFLTYDFGKIECLVQYQPDIIIFQLGENVKFTNDNTPYLFKEKYIELINCFKKGRKPNVICTTPFFFSSEKNKIIEEIVLDTGSHLADLSKLTSDKYNYATNEENYAGDKSVWKVDGIGRHPGDYGMKNIAEQIFNTINSTIESSLKKMSVDNMSKWIWFKVGGGGVKG